MRKFTFIFLVTILFSKTFSQDSKFVLGMELTPTIKSLRGNVTSGDSKFGLGFSTGFQIDYLINSHLSLKSGLAYERKGSYVDLNLYPDGTDILNVNYNYLTLPVLGSFYTKGKTKFYINAGTYFGFLINQSYNYSSDRGSGNIYENTKTFDFGLSFGFGIYIPMGSKLLLDIGLIENFGLIDTSKEIRILNNRGILIYDGSVKTNSFGMLMGLKYKI